MEKSNKNDDEKKESFFKKYWEIIKKVVTTLYFIGIYFIIFYLLLSALKVDLNFSVIIDFMLVVIFIIIGFLFAWWSDCEYLKKLNLHKFTINLIFNTEIWFKLIIIGYLLEKISSINYFLISILIAFIILSALKKYKEKYIKIINQFRKCNISIISFFSLLILLDIILTLIKKPFFINIIFAFLKDKNVFTIIFFIFSLIYLFYIRISKNEYFNNKNMARLLVDIIFIFEFFYLIILDIGLLLPIFVKNDIDVYGDIKDILLAVLSMGTVIYIINSAIKNIWKIKYSIIFSLIFFTFLLGSISIAKFLGVTLFVAIVNIFLSDTILLYKNSHRIITKNNNIYYNSIIEHRAEEKNCSRKLFFNIVIFMLYIYLIIIENDRLGVLQFLANKFNITVFDVAAYPMSTSLFYFSSKIKESDLELFFNEIFKLSYIGILRVILLVIIIYIILIILAFILYVLRIRNKTSFKTELDKFYIWIKYIPIKLIRKFVYIKKIKKLKNKRTNKEIKVLMYMDYFLNFNRIYKYKNVRLYKVINVNSKFKKPNSN
ncbi:hypothetical protein NM219_06615 [Parvimonas micra]|uniref:hypothetical protein n=1 Tax=Parvimonas micra TaxID=33033 RepID=UPI0022B6DC67|nr:hypothetical protein [Parvimonas micra]WBB33684.1 hypothetical protein NM220_06615 [Parvimonas micra]WBB35205.1 hypothetical protein NM219_06615 [Parvimonas micra]